MWDKHYAYTWYGSVYQSYRNISDYHYHKYRHYNYYPATGYISVMHADVEKIC